MESKAIIIHQYFLLIDDLFKYLDYGSYGTHPMRQSIDTPNLPENDNITRHVAKRMD